MDLGEGEDGVGGDKDRVAFHPAAVGVHPGTVFALVLEELDAEVVAPVGGFAIGEVEVFDVGDAEPTARLCRAFPVDTR